MFERGMRVRLRDRLWEVEESRARARDAFLDLRRADERPGPRRADGAEVGARADAGSGAGRPSCASMSATRSSWRNCMMRSR